MSQSRNRKQELRLEGTLGRGPRAKEGRQPLDAQRAGSTALTPGARSSLLCALQATAAAAICQVGSTKPAHRATQISDAPVLREVEGAILVGMGDTCIAQVPVRLGTMAAEGLPVPMGRSQPHLPTLVWVCHRASRGTLHCLPHLSPGFLCISCSAPRV